MLKHIYGIKDLRASLFLDQLITEHNAQTAIRTVKDIVNAPNSVLGKYPEDYQLFEIATIETGTGVMTPTNILVIDIKDLKDDEPNTNK